MPKILESDIETVNVVENPHFDHAVRILKQKKWKGVSFAKPFGGKIEFCPEIEANPADPNDWMLHIFYVPDLKKPDHEHLIFSQKEIRKIQRFLNQLTDHIEKLKERERKRKDVLSNKKTTKKIAHR